MAERYSVDRIVDGIATLVHDGDGATIYIEAAKYSLSVNDIVDVTFDGDLVLSLTKDEEEKQRRLMMAKSRLHSLFNKSKRN